MAYYASVRLRTCLSSYHGWGCGFTKLRLGLKVVGAAVCMGEMGPHWLCHVVQPVPGDTMVSCPGDQSDHKLALRNIASMVRPGGVLVIDHRNYDHILATGCAPPGKNIYYKVGGWQTQQHLTPLCPNPRPQARPDGAGLCPGWGPPHLLRTQTSSCGLQSDLTKDITTSVLLVNNKAHMVTLDYTVQVPPTEVGAAPELR